MSAVFQGRYAAKLEEPVVVFLIGVSINRPLAIRRWLPVVMAMGPMMRELSQQPDLGLLGSRFFVSWPLIMGVQYWRSFDALEAYARNRDAEHLPAWRRFNQEVGRSEDVGVFHETYQISPGQAEAVYVNMPQFGLAKAVAHVPATGERLTARRRLGGQNEAAIASADD